MFFDADFKLFVFALELVTTGLFLFLQFGYLRFKFRYRTIVLTRSGLQLGLDFFIFLFVLCPLLTISLLLLVLMFEVVGLFLYFTIVFPIVSILEGVFLLNLLYLFLVVEAFLL